MGGSGRIPFRQCQGEAPDSGAVCGKPAGICPECNISWKSAAKRPWRFTDRGAAWGYMGGRYLYHTVHGGIIPDSGELSGD